MKFSYRIAFLSPKYRYLNQLTSSPEKLHMLMCNIFVFRASSAKTHYPWCDCFIEILI